MRTTIFSKVLYGYLVMAVFMAGTWVSSAASLGKVKGASSIRKNSLLSMPRRLC
jgi:hypothetical protein